MKFLVLTALSIPLAACNMMPGASPPLPSPERTDAFVSMVEGAGCELPREDNDALLRAGGFSDAEAGAISRQMLANGQAEISADGNLVLMSENCV